MTVYEKTWYIDDCAWEKTWYIVWKKWGCSRTVKYENSRIKLRKQNCFISNRCDFIPIKKKEKKKILTWNSTKLYI